MFAEKLKQVREENHISQAELANTLHISQGTIGNWETGKRIPDVEMLKTICNLFDVSLDWLTGKSKYRNNQEYKEYSWGITSDPFFEAPFDFCPLLKEIREEQDVTSDEMRKVIGFTKEQYDDCEEGIIPITYEQAENLCKYLGTNVSQVLFDNQLYDEEVPEKYQDNVREWEKIKENLDKEARNENIRRTPAPTKSPATKEDLKFALFNGSEGITDEMYEEVKAFAELVKLREEQKKGKK